MKKALLLSLYFSSFISAYLNADEVVGLEGVDINTTKTDSRKDDGVQFAIEFGAKTDFWSPGLSKEQGGGEILKYDTEGLYLGSAILKTKIYGTDVFSIEKFGTLKSSDDQNKLLKEYENDRDNDSSFEAFRVSIQITKILNYLFETDIFEGLEYGYTTRNFIGSATLEKDSIFWFGDNQGIVNTDYYEYSEGKKLSFKTKFVNQELFYKFGNLFDRVDNPKGDSMRFMLGGYIENWEKPTYIGSYFENKPILYNAKYESKGALIGLQLGSKTFDLGLKWYIGINNKVQLTDSYDAGDDFDVGVGMQKLDLYFVKRLLNIYSNRYLNIDFLINANAMYTTIYDGGVVQEENSPGASGSDPE